MESSNTWPQRVVRVANYIHAHLEQDLEPAALANLADFSLHHFHRVFRGMTGESVMGFVRRLRLERAAQQLKFSAAPVTDVAFASGYNSHEAFTRAFRARFGMPPAEYRSRESAIADPVQCDCEVRDEPARVAFALRHVGPYDGCDAVWGALYAWAHSSGVANHEQAALGLCYDDPDVTEAARIRYDACIVVPKAVANPAVITEFPAENMSVRVVPAGRYAIAVHRGPYDSIHSTYLGLLGRWLPHRGVELADEPVVEVYLNSPMTTAPADLRTEVCVRIA